MKSPHRIGLPPGMRVLHIEREPGYFGGYYPNGDLCEEPTGYYKLWLHTSDRLLGTYLKLHDNGKIERVTVRATEGDEIVLIKPED